MSQQYQAVQWNRNKIFYDFLLGIGLCLFFSCFFLLQSYIDPNITLETTIIRSTSTCAFFLLHIILSIGPLCRIHPYFLPLLYNRRHLGVMMFSIAAVHAVFSTIQFHALGDMNPIASIFLSNTRYQEISRFPFQIFGFFAFIILLFMALTSHDFWLKHLSPQVWKMIHSLVYVAYILIFLHVALGIVEHEQKIVYNIFLFSGFFLLICLHIAAAYTTHTDYKSKKLIARQDGFYYACKVKDIKPNRAKIVQIASANIAIFKYENKLSAVSNVCKHQMGPLGEGKIIDGCITCPWHGYQYLPESGVSPPPFEEKIMTYHLKLVGNQEVWVHPNKESEEGIYIPPVTYMQSNQKKHTKKPNLKNPVKNPVKSTAQSTAQNTAQSTAQNTIKKQNSKSTKA